MKPRAVDPGGGAVGVSARLGGKGGVFNFVLLLLVVTALGASLIVLHKRSKSQPAGQKMFDDPWTIRLAEGDLPSGSIDRNRVNDVFKDLYVDNVMGTDCTFIAAFMLMVQHDPEYPYKIMRALDGEGYLVRFPGYDSTEAVAPRDLEKFLANSGGGKWRWQSLYRRHHVPLGIEILRSAYYDAQRRIGERPPEYRVYGGGHPVSDLMVLSGIREGGVIRAETTEGADAGNTAVFLKNRAKKTTFTLKGGRTIGVFSEDAGESVNPLKSIAELRNYMIIACSAANFSINQRIFGKTIPNHAYYLLGMTRNGEYIFGNPYQTKKTVVLSDNDILNEFNAVHYVKMQ